MMLRTVLLVLAFLAFLSTSVGGYLYFSTLLESARHEAHEQAAFWVKYGENYLSSSISERLDSVKALAGLKEIGASLAGRDPGSLTAANEVLDHFHHSFHTDVCYLMDNDGLTLASSNRYEPDSFVGKNYSFRPYFRQALEGQSAVYLAIGVTSMKRGVYFSHQVSGGNMGLPLGVVVIKDPVQALERTFLRVPHGYLALTNEQGLVFAASRPDWLNKFVWKSTPEILEQLKKNKQFGLGPWPWLGFTRTGESQARDREGREYILHVLNVRNLPGWFLVYLRDSGDIVRNLSDPLLRRTGVIVMTTVFFIGLAVLFLYKNASQDLAKRKAVETALKESEARFRSIVENSQEGILILDDKYKLTYINDEMSRILSRPKGEIINHDFRVFLDAESREIVSDKYLKRQKGEEVPRRYEFNVVRPDGEKRRVEISAALIGESTGEMQSIGLLLDITERKRADDALRESEEKYRTVVEGNPDPLVVYDMEGLVVYFNPAFTKVFGWPLEERVGQKLDLFVPESTWPETKIMIEKVLAGESFFGVETRRLTRDGTIIPVSISGCIYRDNNRKPLGSVINIRDIREQKSLESQLQQARKMEAVGTLASGIAHDFNNLLQAISGYVQLLMRKETADQLYLDYLAGVDQAVSRATDLVQRMLTFGRKVKTEPRPLDLKTEILQTVAILERTIPKMIDIVTTIDDDLMAVNGDPGQLAQILLNLGANAKDAMPDGGKLIIEARNATLDQEYTKEYLELEPGRYVLLTVSDTGYGMDEETIKHIFDPFFTTKPVGSGTGLGLSTIYGIVKAHGGYISCRSIIGRGASFQIYLPAISMENRKNAIKPPPREDLWDGEETIMIVDDEEAIRVVADETLQMHGYKTIQAQSGEEALNLYKKNRNINLVILDLGMPGMGGTNCLKELLAIDPDLKVIISSGYSQDGPINQTLTSGAKSYVKKPYRLTNLLKTIREVLDGRVDVD